MSRIFAYSRRCGWKRCTLVAALVLAGAVSGWAIVNNLRLVADLHEAQAEHADQSELTNIVRTGRTLQAFEETFELGDELFATSFNALDGVGADVGNGQRFTRVPRADEAAWLSHRPPRATGPNAQSCNECHGVPFEDGAGGAASNNIRDPLRTANLRLFINRQAPHLFGLGAVQRLAEEMSEELQAIRDRAIASARFSGSRVTARLQAKGVSFGSLVARPDGSVEIAALEGVDRDLIVKPFDWKGVFPTVRSFNRDAAHNELGMQAVEMAGDGIDGDYDGVANELTVGDITALAIYNAAQPRPTMRTELANLGLIDRLPPEEIAAINRGGTVFNQTGCASCHRPELRIENPIFSEPSQNPNYRDAAFPAGQNPVSRGVDPRFPITFDLTRDQPDNQVTVRNLNGKVRLGSFERDTNGRAIVRLFGDLKRHDMGQELAEPIDADGIPAQVFLTKPLWGIGSTAPYLHDGRATTLTEAILAHGGEANTSRQQFVGNSSEQQRDLIAFLNNLVLFKLEETESETNTHTHRPRTTRQ